MTDPHSSELPADAAAATAPNDGTEPADSPQRRLVESVAAYEVDPPAPERARPGAG